ncbi:MAG: alpha/beta hydrolase, partial [Edaphobacter sp.]
MNRRHFVVQAAAFATAIPSSYAAKPMKGKPLTERSNIPLTTIHHIQADGIKVFYREAGPADAPILLLLHGFPTSSFQYRELIPRLA